MLDINDLNAHADRVAQKLGAHAAVGLVTLEPSHIEPGGERVKLSVFRKNISDSRHTTFAPDSRDLKARIEQEIPRLVASLT